MYIDFLSTSLNMSRYVNIDDSFCDGSVFEFTLVPTECSTEDGEDALFDDVSPDMRRMMIEYMQHPVFLDFIGDTASSWGSRWPDNFTFWYEVKVHSGVPSLRDDGDVGGLRIRASVSSKEVSPEAFRSAAREFCTKKRPSVLAGWFRRMKKKLAPTITPERRLERATAKAAADARHMRRHLVTLSTFDNLVNEIQSSLSEMTNRGDVPRIADFPDVEHIRFSETSALRDLEVTDDQTRPVSEILLRRKLRAAAEAWKRILTNPHDERGRRCIMRRIDREIAEEFNL